MSRDKPNHFITLSYNVCSIYCRYQYRCSEESRPDSRRKITHSRSFTESLPKHVYEVDEKSKTSDQVRSFFSLHG